ncbi:MAG: histidine kinase dimerization/phosphoacceptor domain -containing protein [bacterium]
MLRDFDNARIFYRKGLFLSVSLHNQEWNGVFFQELGRVEQTTGNIDSALALYNKGLSCFQKGGNKNSILRIYNSIGSIYLDKGRYDDAIAFYLNLLRLKEPSLRSQEGTINTRIAHAYEQKNLFQKALEHNKKALAIRHEMSQMEDYNSSLINIAGDYFFLNKMDSGWIFMNEGLRTARANGRPNLLENGNRMLYRFYNSRNDFKNALIYFKRYTEIGDSIIVEKNKGDIAILEANQRIRSIEEGNILLVSENEIQSLSLKNQRFQINFLQIILSVSFIFIIYSLLQYFRNIRAKKEIQQIYSRMSKEMSELEITNRKISEQEHQYRFLAENSLDFITRFDKNMNCIYASPSAMKIYGYSPEEILMKSTFDLTHPDFHPYAGESFQEMIRDRTPKHFIYLSRKKSGEEFWAESIMNPIYNNETGILEEFVGVIRDIQERKMKELEIMEGTNQKENLLKEIHHRVKNNFAILVSLINMQKDQAHNADLIQSLTDLQLRIRTMALVHEMLYRSKDFENISFSDYIRSLSSVITGTFNRRDIQLKFDIQEITMDIEAAIPLGLIINEILNNAYRHAFPDGRTGIIQVILKRGEAPYDLNLTISDDGVGMPDGFSLEHCKTMGIQIVQILVKQIEGEINIKSHPGSTFSISFSRRS